MLIKRSNPYADEENPDPKRNANNLPLSDEELTPAEVIERLQNEFAAKEAKYLETIKNRETQIMALAYEANASANTLAKLEVETRASEAARLVKIQEDKEYYDSLDDCIKSLLEQIDQANAHGDVYIKKCGKRKETINKLKQQLLKEQESFQTIQDVLRDRNNHIEDLKQENEQVKENNETLENAVFDAKKTLVQVTNYLI